MKVQYLGKRQPLDFTCGKVPWVGGVVYRTAKGDVENAAEVAASTWYPCWPNIEPGAVVIVSLKERAQKGMKTIVFISRKYWPLRFILFEALIGDEDLRVLEDGSEGTVDSQHYTLTARVGSATYYRNMPTSGTIFVQVDRRKAGGDGLEMPQGQDG